MSRPLVLPQSADSERSCTDIHVLRPCLNKAEQNLQQLDKRFQEWLAYRQAQKELCRAVAVRAIFKKEIEANQVATGKVAIGEDTSRAREELSQKADALKDATSTLHGVNRLLARLDNMQQRLAEALRVERTAVSDLQADLKKMDMMRLQELPKIAQHGMMNDSVV